MKKVTICLKNRDIDELEVLLFSEYDACTIGNHGLTTLYSWKASKAIKLLHKSVNCSSEKLWSFLFLRSWNDRTKVHPDSIQDFAKSPIIWVKLSSTCPYWPAYIVDCDDTYIHFFYISRSRFSRECRPVTVKKSKAISYSSHTVTKIMIEGLNYYRNHQMWDYFSEFYNAILLAKTFISFKKRGYFFSQYEVFQFFNSDLPKDTSEDAHTPYCDSVKKMGLVRHHSMINEDIQKPSKRRKTNTLVKQQSDSEQFQQRVYDYILSGECDDHLHGILDGSIFCERWEVIDRIYHSSKQLRSWRQSNINPYWSDEWRCDNLLVYLKEILFGHQNRMGRKIRISRFLHLLYDVLYPESIIEGIGKLQNLSHCDADMMYINTMLSVDDEDKAFRKKLSNKERMLASARMTV